MHSILLAFAFAFVHVNGLVWPIDSKGSPVPGSIRTFYMNPQNLWGNRQLYRSGYHQLNPAVNRVVRRCTGAYNDNNTYSVVNKPAHLVAPSNDPHDYYSLARYFWPNASVPGGLPYMRADGFINPEIYLIPDVAYLNVMFDDVRDCSLAYFFTGNETFSGVAVRRLRDWFLNPATRMNPTLQYANWVKGTPVTVTTGNGTGISVASNSGGLLDFIELPYLVDSIGLLTNSKAFTSDDYNGMASWFQQYLNWLRTSSRGVTDSASPNNQGTWYDVQAVSLQLFLGLNDDASNLIGGATIPRIGTQLLPSGAQPLEQARALSWLYSSFNLKALFHIAYLSQSTKVNLFQYQDSQGRSIVKALDYLLPFATTNGTGWPVINLGDFKPDTVIELSKEAYVVYRDSRYLQTANALQNDIPHTANVARLWNPYLAFDNLRSSALGKPAGVTLLTLCISGLTMFLMI